MAKFNGKDWLLTAILQQKHQGALVLTLPDNLTFDEMAELRNTLMIPGVRTMFTGDKVCLTKVLAHESSVNEWVPTPSLNSPIVTCFRCNQQTSVPDRHEVYCSQKEEEP